MPSGIDNGRCKLTEDDVDYIYHNPHKMTQHQLADIYGIAQSTVNHICRKRRWRHLTDDIDGIQDARASY